MTELQEELTDLRDRVTRAEAERDTAREVAEACVARQRRLVARLDAVGAAPAAHAELARGLLGEMERALALLRRRRERPGATGSGEAGTASALDVAA